MAKIYSTIIGDVCRFVRNDEEEKMFSSPCNYKYVLDFDIKENPEIYSALNTDWSNVKVIDSKVYYRGVQINVKKPRNVYEDYHQIDDLKPLLDDYLKSNSPTSEETVIAMKIMIRLLLVVFDLFLKQLKPKEF